MFTQELNNVHIRKSKSTLCAPFFNRKPCPNTHVGLKNHNEYDKERYQRINSFSTDTFLSLLKATLPSYLNLTFCYIFINRSKNTINEM